jgi:Glutaminase
MEKVYLILVLLIFHGAAFSSSGMVSAKRELGVDYSIYENQSVPEKSLDSYSTAQGASRKYTGQGLPSAVAWTPENLSTGFTKIRDERSLDWSRRQNFPRRIFWLYPNDGCFARAALANRMLKTSNYPVPNTVYVFGNLKVQTENSPWGYAAWWFHVAPVVEVNGEKFVLDPALDPHNPLKLQDWLAKMGDPSKMKVAICGSGTYSPSDDCADQSPALPASSTKTFYLNQEWDQQAKIGHKPEVVLGENPPW